MTIGAVVLGIILGFCLRLAQPGPDAILLINFPGDLLIRMLKMLIIPLVVSSLISGMEVRAVSLRPLMHFWSLGLCFYTLQIFPSYHMRVGPIIFLWLMPDSETKTRVFSKHLFSRHQLVLLFSWPSTFSSLRRSSRLIK